MTSSQVFTIKSLETIFNKRKMATQALVGRKVQFIIQGNGNVIDVLDKAGNPVPSITDGSILQKKIFNVRANSEVAVKNQRSRDLLAQIKIANKAGDANKVDELVREYLNKVQLSFSVLSGTSLFDNPDLQNGAEISATLQQVDTENGSLLTLDASTLSVMAPATLSDSKFTMDLEDDDHGGAPEAADPNEKITLSGQTFTRAQWNSSGWTNEMISAELAKAAVPAPPAPGA